MCNEQQAHRVGRLTGKNMIWKEVKKMRKGESVRQVDMEDGDGRILTVENEVCERWQQYLEARKGAHIVRPRMEW